MNVLHLGKFYPPPFGGMETVLRDLVRMTSREARVDVLAANTENRTIIGRLGRRGLLVRAASRGAAAGVSLAPGFPALLGRLLRRRRYDLVHVHLPNPLAHAALALARWKGKVVLHWHSDIIRQKQLLRLYRPFMDRLIERADLVLAATPRHFTSSTQIDPRFAGKCLAIPYGLDLEPYASTPEVLARAAELRARLGGGRPLVFACGRHIYYKGYEYLVRAMGEEGPAREAVLVLGGTGPLTESLRRLAAERGVAGRVHFPGVIPDGEIAAHYHAADVLCMPSVEPSEAFGMVQIEAMACSKPVVCCELNNGVSWVNRHGETGLVVPPRDPVALADALGTLLGDSALRRRMGEAGRARAEREFSLGVVGRRYLDAYRAVMAGRPPEPVPDRPA